VRRVGALEVGRHRVHRGPGWEPRNLVVTPTTAPVASRSRVMVKPWFSHPVGELVSDAGLPSLTGVDAMGPKCGAARY
jgi:hypothetical protein